MKIGLFVENICLGELTFVDKHYIFSPNAEKIELARKNYPAVMSIFCLPTNKDLISNGVPRHFDDYLDCLNRDDIIQKANILEEDGEFEKLFKLSKLDFFNNGFKIKQIID